MIGIREALDHLPWLVTVDLADYFHCALPDARVRRRLARQVPSIEFCDGGVDVVDVEHDMRRDPIVGVDLDNVDGPRRRMARVGAVARNE